MTKIGIQASHEQFAPDYLLEMVRHAEKAGFDGVLASDHVEPWATIQGNSAFTWSWLGSALQATQLTYSSVSVPGYRYHPVIVAQAVATLAQMYPGRFIPCLGSGEALNEHIIGGEWPDKDQRNQILYESVTAMRRLWKGETVTHHGLITIDDATLHSLPSQLPQVMGAALSVETAEWVGSWADGLLTAANDAGGLRERAQAFTENGGAGKPIVAKVDCSYANTYDEALQGAYDQWRYLLLPLDQIANLRTPQEFEAAAQRITKEDVAEKIPIITSSQEAIDWLRPLMSVGVEKIFLHNVNTNQLLFVDDFGRDVLPHITQV